MKTRPMYYDWNQGNGKQERKKTVDASCEEGKSLLRCEVIIIREAKKQRRRELATAKKEAPTAGFSQSAIYILLLIPPSSLFSGSVRSSILSSFFFLAAILPTANEAQVAFLFSVSQNNNNWCVAFV